MNEITVLIPTLNEAENIDLLVQRLLTIRKKGRYLFDILFVDSASQDGTCDKVVPYTENAPVYLLRRDVNVGLAGAVLAGAHFSDSRYILVMDSDLSHPPEKIPDLLNPLIQGTCDMTIGSRYVKGGRIVGWPFSRRLCSRLATMPALLFCDVKDPLAGFFAVPRRLLVGLSKDVPGFKIALALLGEFGKELRVQEIPIHFKDRDLGESKMNRSVVFAYLRQLLGLALVRPKRVKN